MFQDFFNHLATSKSTPLIQAGYITTNNTKKKEKLHGLRENKKSRNHSRPFRHQLLRF